MPGGCFYYAVSMPVGQKSIPPPLSAAADKGGAPGIRIHAEHRKYLFKFVEIVFRFHRLSKGEHYLDRSPAGRELLGVELQKDFPRVGNATGDRWIVIRIVGIANHCAGHFLRFNRFRLGNDNLETIGGRGRSGVVQLKSNHDSHNDEPRVRSVILIGLEFGVLGRLQGSQYDLFVRRLEFDRLRVRNRIIGWVFEVVFVLVEKIREVFVVGCLTEIIRLANLFRLKG